MCFCNKVKYFKICYNKGISKVFCIRRNLFDRFVLLKIYILKWILIGWQKSKMFINNSNTNVVLTLITCKLKNYYNEKTQRIIVDGCVGRNRSIEIRINNKVKDLVWKMICTYINEDYRYWSLWETLRLIERCECQSSLSRGQWVRRVRSKAMYPEASFRITMSSLLACPRLSY